MDAVALAPKPTVVVINEAIASVPPGRAFRRYEKVRYKWNGKRPEATEEKKLRSGARWLVMETIRSMAISGTLRRRVIDGVEYLELTDLGRRRFGIPKEVGDGREDEGHPQAD